MPSPEYCQGIYDQLVWNGAPNAAKQMAGEAHSNAAFLEEIAEIPPELKADMQACAGMTAKKMIEDAAADMTPAERAQSRKRTEDKLKKAGYDKKPGKLKVQKPGTTSSHQDYNDIIEAIDTADAKEGPFGFLAGKTMGIPNWALYAGGAYLLYSFVMKKR